MFIEHYIYKIVKYIKQNGFTKTFIQILNKIYLKLFKTKYIIYYIELSKLNNIAVKLENPLNFYIKKSLKDFSKIEIDKFLQLRNRRRMHYLLNDRFNKGAELWLAKKNNQITCFLWTIKGRAPLPYFMPITENDVVIFDIEVLHEYRGRSYADLFVTYVFNELKKAGIVRVFIEVHEWNKSMLRHVAKNKCYQIYGKARKLIIFNRSLVLWSK